MGADARHGSFRDRFHLMLLRDLEFDGAEFIDCDFTDVEFRHVMFTDCTFDNCTFIDRGVGHALARDLIVFDECTFTGCATWPAAMHHVAFKECTFDAASHMRGTDLVRSCDFSGADFGQRTNSFFEAADLRGSNFAEVKNVSMEEVMSGATLIDETTVFSKGKEVPSATRHVGIDAHPQVTGYEEVYASQFENDGESPSATDLEYLQTDDTDFSRLNIASHDLERARFGADRSLFEGTLYSGSTTFPTRRTELPVGQFALSRVLVDVAKETSAPAFGGYASLAGLGTNLDEAAELTAVRSYYGLLVPPDLRGLDLWAAPSSPTPCASGTRTPCATWICRRAFPWRATGPRCARCATRRPTRT